jgi:hypothetical protein
MLMNLLPGLRELRAPLASGYLWLISAWLLLGHMDLLPSGRPAGNGEVARLWDLGGTLGKTAVLAVTTFIAYLIGSFLEMDPDGRVVDSLRRVVLVDRRPWFAREPGAWLAHESESVARSISREARKNLMDFMEQRNLLPAEKYRDDEAIERGLSVREMELERIRKRREKRERREKERKWKKEGERVMGEPEIVTIEMPLYVQKESDADAIIIEIIREIPQLASRLLVSSQDLYGKYDRQMGEASVRINVSIPLTVLLILANWLSDDLPVWLQLALTFVSIAFGFTLLRQGFLRAVSARDTIVQALVIGQVESRYIPPEQLSR